MKNAILHSLFLAQAMAIQLDISSTSSIASVAGEVAANMMSYYTGDQPGQVPGDLPGSLNCNPQVDGTYCWWESGAMWGALINYWQYTNDSKYNSQVQTAIQFQRGPENNFNPPNQSRSMGIDDQVFWAFTALNAVEANFPEVGGDAPSWLSLAQGVFNFETSYFDTSTCGGGYRWQVYPFESGYNLKNAIANGGNFQLAARLAYVTGNQSYADWANKVYDWMETSPLFEVDKNGMFYFWDNTDVDNNCTTVAHLAWSYNYGTLLSGAAYMYNFTNGSSLWQGRVDMILNGTFNLFFPSQYGGNIMVELECETKLNCDQDQKSFKAQLARWLAVTAQIVPSTASQIIPKLQASAQGAAGQCSGGGDVCGMQWWNQAYDGQTGVGEEMSALSVIGANLMTSDMAPLSLRTGATSKSNPNAGTTSPGLPTGLNNNITKADRAGAVILTLLTTILVVGGAFWIAR